MLRKEKRITLSPHLTVGELKQILDQFADDVWVGISGADFGYIHQDCAPDGDVVAISFDPENLDEDYDELENEARELGIGEHIFGVQLDPANEPKEQSTGTWVPDLSCAFKD